MVSLCPEFPNDNPALHRGVSWVCLDVTGDAVAVHEAIDAALEPLALVPHREPLIEVADVAAEIAEIAEALALAIEPEAHERDADGEAEAQADLEPASVSVADLVAPFEIEDVPAPRISGIVPVGQDVYLDDEADDEADDEILVEELPPLDGSVCLEGVVANEPAVEPASVETVAVVAAPATTLPPAPDDPFTVLLGTLADVAVGAGSPHVASVLPGLLLEGRLDHAMSAEVTQALAEANIVQGTEVTATFAAQTRAWRAILGGESDDFAACGSAMLDEWAAELLARLLGAPSRATALRRELREHGVAAFGLVEAA